MRVSMWMALAGVMLLGTAGCPPEEDKSEDGTADDTDGDTNDDTDDDTLDDTYVYHTGTTDEPLEVAAIGWEFTGVWDQTGNTLEPWLFPDIYGTYGYDQPRFPYVLITLANLEYFSSAGEPDEDMYCEIGAEFVGGPGDFPVEAFDYDNNAGSTGIPLPVWGLQEGHLEIYYTSDGCLNLDTALFPSGEPTALLDGMHFGFGYGPLSPYLEETLAEGDAEWDNVKQAYISQFIAINHPDGSGGVDFIGFDWNAALLVETDFDVCTTVFYYDDAGVPTEEGVDLCGQIQIDVDDLTYVLGDQEAGPIHAYTQGFSMWLEDTPNFDLTLLKDGAI